MNEERDARPAAMSAAAPRVTWEEEGRPHTARWRSESGAPAPRRIVIADDRMSADEAWRLACEGMALLWRGDFHNARQLLQAIGRRIGRKPAQRKGAAPLTPADSFHRHRMAQAQRARTLGMLLVPLDAGYRLPLRRAPDVREACTEAWGVEGEACLVSLREILGLIGAHEWRRNGVPVAVLDARIHPHYGVFSPVRGEYLDLVATAPLPGTDLAFDIGTGTGVLAALLARRGVAHVIATDLDPRALACARDNLDRLGLAHQVGLLAADLFPEGRADLVVCNPPWLPGRPTTSLDAAIYDPDSRMLRGFLDGLAEHLTPRGEGWLVLSDLAEHLGLRSRETLLGWIAAAGLKVLGRDELAPRHPKSRDADDPLHEARKAERTSLWRLAADD